MGDFRGIIPLTGRYVEKVNDQTLETSRPVKTERFERTGTRKPAPGETVEPASIESLFRSLVKPYVFQDANGRLGIGIDF